MGGEQSTVPDAPTTLHPSSEAEDIRRVVTVWIYRIFTL